MNEMQFDIANLDNDFQNESDYTKMSDLSSYLSEHYGEDGMSHLDCSNIEIY